MNIRLAARAVLIADTGVLVPLLPGGIYPTGEDDGEDVTAVTRATTPDAFDGDGDVLPCALVAEETAAQWGPYRTSTLGSIRVWLYQQGGREVIEQAQVRIAALLDNRRLMIGGLPRTLRYAGYGPSGVTDPALRDAKVGWVRFQAVGLVVLPS